MSTADPHRLYVHLAWSTVARVAALDPVRRAAIETHLLASCRWCGTDPIEVCALPDRVHLLVRLPASLSVVELARRVRRDVQCFLADSGRVVRWESGFAAATVAPRDVRRVKKRIAALGWEGAGEPASPSVGPSPASVGLAGSRGRLRVRARGVQGRDGRAG